MNRRGFLASLIAGATLDPERLLWEPGEKLISIPKPPRIAFDVATIQWTKMLRFTAFEGIWYLTECLQYPSA